MTDEITWAKEEVPYNIFKAKYAKDEHETPEEFCSRVASIIPEEDKHLRAWVKQAMATGTFFFGGRTLFLAGRKNELNVAGSNCYVVPIEGDTIEDIYKANEEIARIFSRGGGVGTDISVLRPCGARVRNAALTSTGAVSFLDLINTTGEVISQNGRRGAIMVSIDCSHPDVEKLLDIKEAGDRLSSMNVSIKFDDAFMLAVRNDDNYELHFHVDATGEDIKKTIRARDFFDRFCRCQWDWGDPGALFVDRFNDWNLLSGYDDYKVLTTNPCGEVPLAPWGSCNLGSINVAKFVRKDKTFDFAGFSIAVQNAVKALNYAIDYSYDKQPFDMNRKYIDDWRPIGLGIFGYADALILMGLKYGDNKALGFTGTLFETMRNAAIYSSAVLARDYGPFGKYNYELTKSCSMYESLSEECKTYIERHGLRNGQLISIAPTGSISLLAGLYTGGCEPVYKLRYTRTTHKLEDAGKSFNIYSRSVQEVLERDGVSLDTPIEEIKRRYPYMIESHEVDAKARVMTQAIMQKFVDSSISSTVNLPESATVDDIKTIYTKAWESGCKGITVFRDGCKRGNILGLTSAKEKPLIMHDSIKPEPRGNIRALSGKTYTIKKDDRKIYVTINWKDGKMFEIFINSEYNREELAGLTRMISLAMRCGISIESIIDQLFRLDPDSLGFSVGEIINEAYSLDDNHAPAVQYVETKQENAEFTCPNCGSHDVQLTGHCWQCNACGSGGCQT